MTHQLIEPIPRASAFIDQRGFPRDAEESPDDHFRRFIGEVALLSGSSRFAEKVGNALLGGRFSRAVVEDALGLCVVELADRIEPVTSGVVTKGDPVLEPSTPGTGGLTHPVSRGGDDQTETGQSSGHSSVGHEEVLPQVIDDQAVPIDEVAEHRAMIASLPSGDFLIKMGFPIEIISVDECPDLLATIFRLANRSINRQPSISDGQKVVWLKALLYWARESGANFKIELTQAQNKEHFKKLSEAHPLEESHLQEVISVLVLAFRRAHDKILAFYQKRSEESFIFDEYFLSLSSSGTPDPRLASSSRHRSSYVPFRG